MAEELGRLQPHNLQLDVIYEGGLHEIQWLHLVSFKSSLSLIRRIKIRFGIKVVTKVLYLRYQSLLVTRLHATTLGSSRAFVPLAARLTRQFRLAFDMLGAKPQSITEAKRNAEG